MRPREGEVMQPAVIRINRVFNGFVIEVGKQHEMAEGARVFTDPASLGKWVEQWGELTKWVEQWGTPAEAETPRCETPHEKSEAAYRGLLGK